MSAVPRPGDRVRVTYEGVYDGETPGGMTRLQGADDFGRAAVLDLGDAVNVEVLAPEEPPVHTVIIGYESDAVDGDGPWVFERGEDTAGGWRTTGSSGGYTFAQVWERTAVDRQIILPKTS